MSLKKVKSELELELEREIKKAEKELQEAQQKLQELLEAQSARALAVNPYKSLGLKRPKGLDEEYPVVTAQQLREAQKLVNTAKRLLSSKRKQADSFLQGSNPLSFNNSLSNNAEHLATIVRELENSSRGMKV